LRVCRLRGTGGDLIILEEAAYVDNKLFYSVVLPLLEVANTALIGISTPRDDDDGSFYNGLLTKTDEQGKLLFNVHKIQGACERCIEELEDPTKCPHVQMVIPPHKSAAKQKIVQLIFGTENKGTMARESLGVTTAGGKGRFDKASIEFMMTSNCVRIPPEVDTVYVGINPNAGCGGYAVMSAVYVGNVMTIVGMELADVSTNQQIASLVRRHVTDLKTMLSSFQRDVKVLLLPESSLGHNAAEVMLSTLSIPNVRGGQEPGTKSKWGVSVKDMPALTDHMERILTSHNVGIAQHLVSSNEQNCLAQLERQLRAWRAVYKTNGESRKLTYSGRVDCNGKIRENLQDDMCVCVLLLAYWSTMSRQNRLPDFAQRSGE
jgi:hypothetical protein